MDDLEQYLTGSMSSNQTNDPLPPDPQLVASTRLPLWRKLVNVWFRLSCLPEPAADAPLMKREGSAVPARLVL